MVFRHHYKNRDTAQYTNNRAIIVFVALAYLENNSLNKEPKADQQTVKAKPIKANSIANPNKANGTL